MKRKYIALLSVLLLLSGLTTSFAATQPFADAGDIATWALPYVETVQKRGVMEGSGGLFRPKALFSHAELAAVLCRLDASPDLAAAPAFTDVSKDDWFYTYATQATAKGYMTLHSGAFLPDEPVKREEVAFAFAQMLSLDTESALARQEAGNLILEDIAQAEKDFAPALLACANEGIMVGSQGFVRPKDNITREEMAKIIALVLA